MFRIRDPRSLFRFTAIYSYLMLGWNILNIWNYVQLGYTRLMVIEIVKASIAFICGFIFYTYSMLNLVTVIKKKNLLWIPAIALLFSDVLCSIFAIFSILKFNSFVKILSLRQQERGNEEVYVNGTINKKVVNVDCTVLDGSATEETFNEKLKKLDVLKESGSIDMEEYQVLRKKLIEEYLK